MAKILIIEDDERISELIRMNLEFSGFEASQVNDGDCQNIDLKNIDLILLDLMLPKTDGFSLLPRFADFDIPVIIISAKDRIQDKVKGLNLGADDYLTKPFDNLELTARINSVLRRTGKKENNLVFDDITICFDSGLVLKKTRELSLTLKEKELLFFLAENCNRIISRERLLERVWGYEYPGETRTVDMHITRLRKKLDTGRIRTIIKQGILLDIDT